MSEPKGPWPPFDQLTKCDAIAKILESIAEEETAVAELIRAEREKVEAIARRVPVDADAMVAVDNSVESLMETLILFNIVLRSKAKIFNCQCADCNGIA